MKIADLPKHKTMTNDDRLTIALPSDTKKKIYDLKENHGVNPAEWIRNIIDKALNNLEE